MKFLRPTHPFIPMACGFLYLVAIIDWASRAVLAWRLSNTNDASFCAAALEEALLRFGTPRIFNTDQGSTFTAEAFAGKLAATGVAISMDGRGRFMDNIFIERLWRSIKYEEVHLKAYADAREARAGIGSWMTFYNFAPAPGDEQPDADGGVARRHGQNRGGGEGCGYAASLGQRKRVAHIPTAETEAARSGLILEGQGQARSHLKSNAPWSHEWGPVHSLERTNTLDRLLFDLDEIAANGRKSHHRSRPVENARAACPAGGFTTLRRTVATGLGRQVGSYRGRAGACGAPGREPRSLSISLRVMIFPVRPGCGSGWR